MDIFDPRNWLCGSAKLYTEIFNYSPGHYPPGDDPFHPYTVENYPLDLSAFTGDAGAAVDQLTDGTGNRNYTTYIAHTYDNPAYDDPRIPGFNLESGQSCLLAFLFDFGVGQGPYVTQVATNIGNNPDSPYGNGEIDLLGIWWSDDGVVWVKNNTTIPSYNADQTTPIAEPTGSFNPGDLHERHRYWQFRVVGTGDDGTAWPPNGSGQYIAGQVRVSNLSLQGVQPAGFTITTAPLPPENLMILEATGPTVVLGWTAVDGAQSYTVFDNDVNVLTVYAPATTARLTDLTIGSEHHFTVRANACGASSGDSNEVDYTADWESSLGFRIDYYEHVPWSRAFDRSNDVHPVSVMNQASDIVLCIETKDADWVATQQQWATFIATYLEGISPDFRIGGVLYGSTALSQALGTASGFLGWLAASSDVIYGDCEPSVGVTAATALLSADQPSRAKLLLYLSSGDNFGSPSVAASIKALQAAHPTYYVYALCFNNIVSGEMSSVARADANFDSYYLQATDNQQLAQYNVHGLLSVPTDNYCAYLTNGFGDDSGAVTLAWL